MTFLVWVILSATACAWQCAVDFQSAPFVRCLPQISKAFGAFGFSPHPIGGELFVEVFSRHGRLCRQIGKPQQWHSTTWAAGGRFQQSRHGSILSPGSGISESSVQHDGGLSLIP
jgi:hypothetical protein